MPVEIINFPRGLVFPRDTVMDGIGRILNNQIEDPEMRSSVLGEGEHDISPDIPGEEGRTHRHQLIIFKNGNAILRAIPNRRVWKYIHSDARSLDNFRGKMLHMPGDSNVAFVSSIEGDGKELRVFEVLIYKPSEELGV